MYANLFSLIISDNLIALEPTGFIIVSGCFNAVSCCITQICDEEPYYLPIVHRFGNKITKSHNSHKEYRIFTSYLISQRVWHLIQKKILSRMSKIGSYILFYVSIWSVTVYFSLGEDLKSFPFFSCMKQCLESDVLITMDIKCQKKI